MIHLLVKPTLMLSLLALSACGAIAQWFPDKEKDYQYTTQIPELVLPPDLKNPQAVMLPAIAPTGPGPIEAVAPAPSVDAVEPVIQPTGTTAAKQDEMATDETTGPASAENGLAPNQPEPYQVEKITADGATGLRVHAPFPNAWRAVEKALGRKSIEVGDRDEAEKQFAVRYAPDEHGIQDGSFWDEVNFFFYGLRGKEKAYFLKLLDGGQWTDLMVLDEEKNPAKDAGAAELIQLLEEAIRSDFAR